MRPEAISLRIDGNGDRGQYAFTCPECRASVTRPTDRKIVGLLLAAGVEAGAPEEAPEDALPPEDRSPRTDRPAFTLDDLIDLHFLLDDDAWLEEELARGLEPELQR